VSIETKTISRTEEEARVQLGPWVAAQIKRLKAIAGGSSSAQSVLTRMVFPLLFLQSSQWTILVARIDPLNYDRLVRLQHDNRTGLKSGTLTPRPDNLRRPATWRYQL